MRILAVNWLDPENPDAGGAEVHLFEILRRLVAWGDDVAVVTSGWPGAPRRADVWGVDVRRTGGRYTFALGGRRAVRRVLREGTWDIVVEDINKLPLCTPWLTDLPVYVVIPHLFGSTAFREASFPVASVVWLAERLIPWVYGHGEFHAISQSTRDDLVDRGIDPGQIRVIYPGVDAEHLTPDPTVPRTESPSFLYVGRLKRYKGVDTAIRAVAALRSRMPNVILNIAGSGDDRPRLERLTDRLRLRDHVKFLGFVSDADKQDLLRRSWATVFPSSKEGWGITNVEAAACGTPALAANAPGLRESVLDGETGFLFPPDDVDSLASAMLRLASDVRRVEELGRAARSFAERLTWDETARRTRRHLEEAVAMMKTHTEGS